MRDPKIDSLLHKIAALKPGITPYSHQQSAIDNTADSALIAHGVGSGKTLTGVAKFEKLREQGKAKKALVITPAGLRNNFLDEGVNAFTDSKGNIIGNKQEQSSKLYGPVDPNATYNIMSYEMFRQNPEKYLKESGADTIIADEFHKVKNEGTETGQAFKKVRGQYKNMIGLTGSVISNSPADLIPLIDIVTQGKSKLPSTKKEFNDRYLKYKNMSGVPKNRQPVSGVKHKRELRKELAKYVDYLDYDDTKEIAHIPGKNIKNVKVPLSKDQAKQYKMFLKNSPEIKKLIKQKRTETLSDTEKKQMYDKLKPVREAMNNGELSVPAKQNILTKLFGKKDDGTPNIKYSKVMETRRLMNNAASITPGKSLDEGVKMTPKTQRLLDDMQKHLDTTPDGQAILMSYLVRGGSDTLEAGLKSRGIDYGKFSGKQEEGSSEKERQQAVRDYLAGKKRVMVVTPAGAEGLSLKNTTWEGELDPHYNPEKMNQMEARGVRANGLKDRDPKDRVVDINRYLATMPKTLGIFPNKIKTPDEKIFEIQQNKAKQNEILHNILKSGKKRGRPKGSKDKKKRATGKSLLQSFYAAKPPLQPLQIAKAAAEDYKLNT